MTNLTNDEIFILSDGLLALIRDCSDAIKLIPDKAAQKEIHKTIKKYQALNSKLMDEIDKRYIPHIKEN